jgi:hypothetical protein
MGDNFTVMETITFKQARESLGVSNEILENLIRRDVLLIVEEKRGVKLVKASVDELKEKGDIQALLDPDNDKYI